MSKTYNVDIAKFSGYLAPHDSFSIFTPTPNLKEYIQSVLQRDELFGEEFISNHQVLRELLGVPGFLTKKRKKGVENCENVYVESI